jgi:sRNA-binding carbon storage regulator CsrA
LIREKEFPMLVFTRDIGDEVVILIPDQPEIVIKYTRKHRHSKIVLGIQAPREVTVHRREVWEGIKARALALKNLGPE